MSQIVTVILDVNGDYESAADGTVKVMSIGNAQCTLRMILIELHLSCFGSRPNIALSSWDDSQQPKFRCLW